MQHGDVPGAPVEGRGEAQQAHVLVVAWVREPLVREHRRRRGKPRKRRKSVRGGRVLHRHLQKKILSSIPISSFVKTKRTLPYKQYLF